ncbi:hypothetical protein FLACOL_01873 [Flavobacterium columnare]|uniref:Uncharacterized protein n=1 Tax=Flavobacterium columnare TaxID=996 RepID=A0A2N9PC22_9FLAO|nr:hypothetical protein [Flavobacterium columnare]SPE77863.1 hypothetical protein FLACOL_01873 [Flavobacterium columnare]
MPLSTPLISTTALLYLNLTVCNYYHWNELSKTYQIALNDSHRMTEKEYNDYLPIHTEFIAKRMRLLKRIEGVRRNLR